MTDGNSNQARHWLHNGMPVLHRGLPAGITFAGSWRFLDAITVLQLAQTELTQRLLCCMLWHQCRFAVTAGGIAAGVAPGWGEQDPPKELDDAENEEEVRWEFQDWHGLERAVLRERIHPASAQAVTSRSGAFEEMMKSAANEAPGNIHPAALQSRSDSQGSSQ